MDRHTSLFAAELSQTVHLRNIAYIIANTTFGTDEHGKQIKFKPEIKNGSVFVKLNDVTSIQFAEDATENEIINILYNNYLAMETNKVINNFKYDGRVVLPNTDINTLLNFTLQRNYIHARPANQTAKKSLEEIKEIFSRITVDHPMFKTLRFRFSQTAEDPSANNGTLVQAVIDMPCVITGKMTEQRGGKNYVSQYSMKDEIVQKALGMCLAVLTHEVREALRYKGFDGQSERIFNPHMDHDQLYTFQKSRRVATP